MPPLSQFRPFINYKFLLNGTIIIFCSDSVQWRFCIITSAIIVLRGFISLYYTCNFEVQAEWTEVLKSWRWSVQKAKYTFLETLKKIFLDERPVLRYFIYELIYSEKKTTIYESAKCAIIRCTQFWENVKIPI